MYLINRGSERLILFFNGWGADDNIVSHLESMEFDIYTVSSHQNREEVVLDKVYSEIHIVGWSLGVAVAYEWYTKIKTKAKLTVTSFTAINGTLSPIDDTLGLPVDIYDKTIEGWSSRTRDKFNMRMFGGVRAYKKRVEDSTLPKRELEEQLEELIYLKEYFADIKISANRYIRAYIGDSDMIIPTKNLNNFWGEDSPNIVYCSETPHYPFLYFKSWDSIVENHIDISSIDITENSFKNSRVAKQFSKGYKTYNQEAVVQSRVCSKLIDTLIESKLPISGDSVLEIGSGTGILTKKIIDSISPSILHINDIALDAELWLTTVLKDSCSRWKFLGGDAEQINFPQRYNLIISASTFQWFKEPEKFIAKVTNHLNSGDVFALATYGDKNFKELRDMGVKSLDYKSLEWFKENLEANFEIKHITEEVETLHFKEPIDILYHLKRTGVNSLGMRDSTSLNSLSEFKLRYKKADNGEYPLTYNPQYIIVVKR